MQDLSKMSVRQLCMSISSITERLCTDDEVTDEDVTESQDHVAAIQAELTRRMTPPEGHVRLPDGKDVKVLGTLPMTADGCVAEYGRTYWCIEKVPVFDGLPIPVRWRSVVVEMTLESCHPCDDYEGSYTHRPEQCYSTREAAEAARAKEAK